MDSLLRFQVRESDPAATAGGSTIEAFEDQGEIKWASDQEAVTFLGYRPIRSWIGSEVMLLS